MPGRAGGRRSTAAACVVAGSLLLGACASLQGEGWTAYELDVSFNEARRAPAEDPGNAADAPEASASASTSAAALADAPVIRLFAFGGAGEDTAAQRAMTVELARVLEQARASSVAGPGARTIPVVLWLGDNFGAHAPAPIAARDDDLRRGRGRGASCASVTGLWQREAAAALAGVVQQHRAAGFPSFAVLGRREWECGAPELAFQAADEAGPHPWVMPTFNYVVRVFQGGAARVVSSCETGGATICALEDSSEPALLELVMLDTSPWNDPPSGEGGAEQEHFEESLAQQRALLEAVRERAESRPRGDAGPLRLLVTYHPIESAGPHGQGGRYPNAAFMYTEPALQELVDDGLFAGVISGTERDLQVSADISAGVKRSSRYWIDHPVFQVVSGASARYDGHPLAGPRGWSWYKGQALIPDLISTHAGFAELRVTQDEVLALLRARVGKRWRVGAVTIPRGRAPHPVETQSPGMEPCVGCSSRPPRPR